MTKIVFLLIPLCQSAFGALFVFSLFRITPEIEFVFELTDPTQIKEAQAIINEPWIVFGQIIKRKAPYNPRWSYHLGQILQKFS